MMSASRSDSRNSSGPSKSRMRMRTDPRPGATWESEPAPATIRYLAAKRDRLLVERLEGDARVEHLDRVDVVDDVQQVLVVGDGVEAVEGVGDVDQPALALDLGDRLLQRHPARDLLLEEQADHLALVRGLDLLGHDDLDAARPCRAPPGRRRSRCGRSSRSRPGPARLRGGEQHLDRGGAVVASGRCACAGRRRSAAAWPGAPRTLALPPAGWRRAARRAVGVLQLRRRALPGQLLAQAVGRVRAAASADRRSHTSRVSWAVSVSTSPGSKSRPRSPSPSSSS